MKNSHNKSLVLLFLVGVCLSISQFIMIRDFVTILYSEKVVIILVTVAFFLGLSIGYYLSLKFSEEFFESILCPTGCILLFFVLMPLDIPPTLM